MLVNDYISKDFQPMDGNQSVENAMELIHQYSLTHVPVFNGNNFIGNLSKETLEEQEAEVKLQELKMYNELFYINQNGSLLEAIQKFHQYNTNILAVLTKEMQYLGFILMEDVISAMSAMPFISEPGSIMVVEVAQRQFSISEISKIAESNNARIIGLFVTAYENDKVQIALKLIGESLTSVVETFERFNYTVLFKFYKDERDDLMKDRFDMLMKYLDV